MRVNKSKTCWKRRLLLNSSI